MFLAQLHNLMHLGFLDLSHTSKQRVSKKDLFAVDLVDKMDQVNVDVTPAYILLSKQRKEV